MTKKRALGLLFTLAFFFLIACYFFFPHPVIKDPENVTISSILIQRSPSYQEGPADSFIWIPETEEDHALEKEILTYLSQCQENRTFQLFPTNAPLPSWKCMYIFLIDASRPALPQMRTILLGPSQYEEADEKGQYQKSVNISFLDSVFSKRLYNKLNDPDGIRTFVLDALELPEDFL